MDKHIVALSGGKDSTALAIRLREVEPREYIYVCTPTGDELPEMLEHWQCLEQILETPITYLSSGHTLDSLIKKFKMLPNFRARWCTRILKLEPYYDFLEQNAPAVSYVGLRADEDKRNGMIFSEADNIQVRFPMQEWGWTFEDVVGYLDEKEISIPERTDCARCYHQRIGEWWLLWKNFPEVFDSAIQQEEYVQEQTGKLHTFRSKQRDYWPADLASLKKEFETGKIPTKSLNRMRNEKDICRVCTL